MKPCIECGTAVVRHRWECSWNTDAWRSQESDDEVPSPPTEPDREDAPARPGKDAYCWCGMPLHPRYSAARDELTRQCRRHGVIERWTGTRWERER